MSESDQTVYVDLGSAVSDRSYTIEIGRSFLEDAERWLASHGADAGPRITVS